MKKLFTAIALLAALALTACSGLDLPFGQGGRSSADSGPTTIHGELGETIETYFFDFTVNDAYLTDTYATATAAAGSQFLVLDVTVENTFNDEIEMYDIDFQAQWEDDADDAYAWPITWDDEAQADLPTISDAQLPATYTLAKGETRTGELVFELPASAVDFYLCHEDAFDDDTTGDTYFVYIGSAAEAEDGSQV